MTTFQAWKILDNGFSSLNNIMVIGSVPLFNTIVLNVLLRACCVLLLVTANGLQAEGIVRWEDRQLNVGIGSIIDTSDGLKIQANDSGQIFISVGVQGIVLDKFSALLLECLNVPGEAQYFIAWRTTSGAEGMHPFSLSSEICDQTPISMSAEENWTGIADQIGLGIKMAPYGVIRIKSMSLSLPQPILTRLKQHIRDWSSFRDWMRSDSNYYTGGTLLFEQSVSPAPFFARVLMATLLCYLAYLLLTRQFRRPNWNIAGAIILACWISLDLMWQARLIHQVAATYDRFSGKSSFEKLLASDDASVVQFITRVNAIIDGKASRIFLGSTNDYVAMLSAYYMAPLNTYWHRYGPELPDRKHIVSGDYILLVAPYATHYQAERGLISLPDASNVSVKMVMYDTMGVLLQVI